MMDGYEAQLRLRSSWGFKGLLMPNAPATIDSDYRGEIKLCLRNLNIESVRVKAGDRVAQVVCSPVFCPKIHIMDSDEWNSPLNKTLRGEGGFGSTGEQ
jgi:dUTP pyrophosphatase